MQATGTLPAGGAAAAAVKLLPNMPLTLLLKPQNILAGLLRARLHVLYHFNS